MSAETFRMDPSGWFHAAPFGEHPLNEIVQVIDRESAEAMVAGIRAEKAAAVSAGKEWPGLLINRDHLVFTDPNADSEAMGWIDDAEVRADGLWLHAKWSVEGEKRISGGVYKFVSPEFNARNGQDLGGRRKRPVELLGCALTNTPNLSGLHPLCNRAATMPDDPAERTTMSELKEIAAALGLDESADLAAVLAKIKEVTESVAAMNKAKEEEKADAFCNKHAERIQDAAAVRELYLKDPEAAERMMNALKAPAAPRAPVTTTIQAQTPDRQIPEGAFKDADGKIWANRLAFHRTLKGAAARKHLREHKTELLRLEQAETK